MKPYPSIPLWDRTPNSFALAFDKLDGSNVRVEVDKDAIKKGKLEKFGKRHGLLDDKTPFLVESRDLITQKYGEKLLKLTKDLKWGEATFFFEFFGRNSFAGVHAEEPHDAVLLDFNVFKKGIIKPREFLQICDAWGLEYPKILLDGTFDQSFADQVWNSTLEGMSFEGVVCKTETECFKFKSKAWLERLKRKCGDDEELFQKLK